MSIALPEDPVARELLRDELRKLEEVELAHEHPAFLLHHVKCVDSRSGEVFRFEMLTREECEQHGLEFRGDGWYWQREHLDWWLGNDQTIDLKGRQLGVTWLACGEALWYLLYKPGADVLVYSITQKDAQEVIGRIWDMLKSLPEHLLNGARIIKPSRDGVRPSEGIEVQHPDGRVSSVQAMASTQSAGHGRSAALIIFDEASRQEYAREAWKAVVPATGDKGGKIRVISTANGMSDSSNDLGNFFHHLWSNAGFADYPRLKKKFLGWWLHPDRDQQWYETVGLKADDRAEQYPNDPEEAFLMSGAPWFDVEHLKWYAQQAIGKPLYRCCFEMLPNQPDKARLVKGDDLQIAVYVEPDSTHEYAIAVDSSSGHGADYTVLAVIDLMTMEPVAEGHAKWDADVATEQVHFLGRWYSHGAGSSKKTALIAPEIGGGYGATMVVQLRDGKLGRPKYPRIFRYRSFTRGDQPQTGEFGFPMNKKTRPLTLDQLRAAIREHSLPWMTEGLLTECRTFVRAETKPSPRAANGCNDDRVMAWAIALELFREFGQMPLDIRIKKRARKKQPKAKRLYPWQPDMKPTKRKRTNVDLRS